MPSASPGCSMLNPLCWPRKNKCLDFSECLRQWSLNVDGQREGGGERNGWALRSFLSHTEWMIFSGFPDLCFHIYLQILAWPETFMRRITTEKEGRACCLFGGCLQSRWKMACSLQCLMFGMRTHHTPTHAHKLAVCMYKPARMQGACKVFSKKLSAYCVFVHVDA